MIKPDLEKLNVEMGSHQALVIDKAFGPTVAMDLRITFDAEDALWVIERQTWLEPDGPQWVEWVKIPAQFDWEFLEKRP